ncbi:GTA-gp10 family protein [Maricaulis maris]|uniref:GTA-gp10 family protein n=1 Tax=Maricaulis maris TaxID=74318 RepID=UPI003B8C4F36
MPNPQRGEIALTLGERTLTLCLTLGALAEIETLCPAGESLTADRLVRVVAALARGGGTPVELAELKAVPLRLDTVAQAVAACLEAGLEP